tara:strand:+ start:105 stop:758 length:654 start_codon:yes stop_codon:yes gene_type:complete
MWSTKISFDGSKYNFLAKKAKEMNIKILIFPFSWSYEKSGVFVNITGVIYGSEKSKKKFIREWKRNKGNRLIEVEFNEDFFIGVAREDLVAKTLYNKNLIFTEPFLIEENGFQTIVLNSFDKKYLERAIKTFEKIFKIKIHYIKNKKINNISFKANAPDLTKKQKEAMNLAITSGYYSYPRKISIKKLATLSKLGFATFHAHLRKAEKKLTPFFFSE